MTTPLDDSAHRHLQKEIGRLNLRTGRFPDAQAWVGIDPIEKESHILRLEGIRDSVFILRKANIEDAPFDLLKSLADKLERFTDRIARFIDMEPVDPEAWTERDTILSELAKPVDSIQESVGALLGYAMVVSRENPEGVVTEVRRLQRRAEEMNQLYDSFSEKISVLSDAVRAQSLQSYVTHFQDEARDQETSARHWLSATVAIGLFFAITAVTHLNHAVDYPRGLPTGTSLQLLGAKAFVFSLGIAAFVWCGRMFRALRHNAAINRHRARALQTFESFAASATDQATRSAILLQATSSIFAVQPTGFLGGDGSPMPTTPPLDLYRIIGGEGSR